MFSCWYDTPWHAVVLQHAHSFGPSAYIQGSVLAAACSSGTRHINGAGGLQPLLPVAPSPTSQQGEERSLPEACKVRSKDAGGPATAHHDGRSCLPGADPLHLPAAAEH